MEGGVRGVRQPLVLSPVEADLKIGVDLVPNLSHPTVEMIAQETSTSRQHAMKMLVQV